MLITLLVFIAILALLVFVHELGHFSVAKWVGVRVDEFAFGFRPRLWGKKIGETLYAINAVPLGGYVRLYGEQEGESGERSLGSKSISQRFYIMVAGAAMNILLGWLLLTILFAVGFQPIFPGVEKNPFVNSVITAKLSAVTDGLPAQLSGLEAGDVITSVNNQRLGVDDLVNYINQHQGEALDFMVDRGGTSLDIVATPRVNPTDGRGALGVTLTSDGVAKTSIWKAPLAAAVETGQLIWGSVVGFVGFLKTLVVHRQVSDNVTGLIGIGALTGVARRLGFSYLVQLVVAITVGLGVINLLPILPLDGGHIAGLIYEKIIGRPLNERQFGNLAAAGIAVVLLLFLLVSYKDITRLNIFNHF